MAAKRSSMVTPHPPGRAWLDRTGQGLATSKNRKATNIPTVSSQAFAPKKSDKAGDEPVFQLIVPIYPKKQIGIATISSSTIEPGSFSPRIVSARLQHQTESRMPTRVPSAKTKSLPHETKSP